MRYRKITYYIQINRYRERKMNRFVNFVLAEICAVTQTIVHPDRQRDMAQSPCLVFLNKNIYGLRGLPHLLLLFELYNEE